MNLQTLKKNFLVFIFALASHSAFASDSNELLTILKNIHTLQGSFKQETIDAQGKELQVQTGTFKLTEAGEFIWNVAQPYQQFISSDGKVLKLYDPDLQQVTLRKLDDQSQVIPLLVFGKSGELLAKHYQISKTSESSYTLIPVAGNHLFESLLMEFKDGKPATMNIQDKLKQQSRVTFSDLVLNAPLEKSTMQLQIPNGVDVVDERQ